jgi:hypothetical protein
MLKRSPMQSLNIFGTEEGSECEVKIWAIFENQRKNQNWTPGHKSAGPVPF